MALLSLIRDTLRALREPPARDAMPVRDEKCVALEARLREHPENPEVSFELGVRLIELGEFDRALDALERSRSLDPDVAVVHGCLGHCHLHRSDLDRALGHLDRALALEPGLRAARIDRGLALSALARPREAVAEFETVLGENPKDVFALNNLSLALTQLGDEARAIERLRQALALAPDVVELKTNLGGALERSGRLGEALTMLRTALEADPGNAACHRSMGTILYAQGETETAIAALERALDLDPDSPALRSNYLFCLQGKPGIEPADLLAAGEKWDRDFGQPLRPAERPAVRSIKNRERLRVGFVSRGFARHPVGFLTIGAIEALDPARLELIFYSDRVREDDFTARYRARADRWHGTAGLSDAALAERVRADGVDILIDLAGHGAGTRLLTFARKPAPIQIKWFEHPGTTGLAAMDYLLTDAHQVPPGTEQFYVEEILRLEHGDVCYEPLADAPAVGPLPAGADGPITFGSFNNVSKVNSSVLERWRRVLEAVPASRLLLKYRGMDDPSVRDRIVGQLEAGGIESGRVTLDGWSPHREHLDAYNRVDIMLDTAPYSGGLTTCEAAFMGVPTLTLPGHTVAGRHTLSHLNVIGLTECVAEDADDFVRRAASLAAARERLAGWRRTLRDRLTSSPLCDREGFAEELTGILLDVSKAR